jgi:hypothetical protein
MPSFDFVPLLVASAAGVGNGLVVKATHGGSHPVLYPGLYEGALVAGGVALDWFGVNPDIGTAMTIAGAALLSQRLVSRVLPNTVAAGFTARPYAGWLPPGAQVPRPQFSGQMVEERRALLADHVGNSAYAPYNLTAAPRSGISTPGVWRNAGPPPGDGQLRPYLDGRGARYPIGRVA